MLPIAEWAACECSSEMLRQGMSCVPDVEFTLAGEWYVLKPITTPYGISRPTCSRFRSIAALIKCPVSPGAVYEHSCHAAWCLIFAWANRLLPGTVSVPAEFQHRQCFAAASLVHPEAKLRTRTHTAIATTAWHGIPHESPHDVPASLS